MSYQPKHGGRKAVVTGMGCICAAGRNVAELKHTLYSPKPLFHSPTRFSLDFDIVAGEIPQEWIEREFPSDFNTLVGQLSCIAAKECLNDGLNNGAGKPEALVLGSSAAGQENNEKFIFHLLDNKPEHIFNFFDRGLVVSPTRHVAQQLDILGSMMTISTACTSSANAVAIGASWIEMGRYKSVLVGGCDDLCPTTLSGFHSLLLTGAEPCRPFGQNRPGMTLGEGAAFLFLEDRNSCLNENRSWYSEITGFGMSVDAYHMTAPSEGGSGAVLAMKKALERAGLNQSQIDWINAHGTGTEMNDRAESQAINSFFKENTPVSSIKGLLGHTLGAAGAIEAIVSTIAINEKYAPENFFHAEPADDCPVTLVPRHGMKLPDHAIVLSNSFGFGGSNCSLIIKR